VLSASTSLPAGRSSLAAGTGVPAPARGQREPRRGQSWTPKSGRFSRYGLRRSCPQARGVFADGAAASGAPPLVGHRRLLADSTADLEAFAEGLRSEKRQPDGLALKVSQRRRDRGCVVPPPWCRRRRRTARGSRRRGEIAGEAQQSAGSTSISPDGRKRTWRWFSLNLSAQLHQAGERLKHPKNFWIS
jgi:hypothetical protein